MEGVYVLELAPGRIKIGRSSNLAARVREHERALVMTGGTARQSWLCAVVDSETVETRALKAIRALPWAEAISREVFTGVTFLEVISLVVGVAQTFPTARPETVVRDEYTEPPAVAPEEARRTADLLAAVLREMDERGVDRLQTRILTDRLGLSLIELTTQLRQAGCRSVRFRDKTLGNLRGWLREDVARARTEVVADVITAHGVDTDAHGAGTSAAHIG